MIFLPEYTFFNSIATCKTISVAMDIKTENKTYSLIKQASQSEKWKYHRVDTQDQIGFPDILLLKASTYWIIEAKLLKKKKLLSIQDDLQWQFGQMAYVKRAFTLNLNYMLVVARNSTLAFIIGEPNEKTKRSNYPNFIELI